jgi:hypothetical protein
VLRIAYKASPQEFFDLSQIALSLIVVCTSDQRAADILSLSVMNTEYASTKAKRSERNNKQPTEIDPTSTHFYPASPRFNPISARFASISTRFASISTRSASASAHNRGLNPNISSTNFGHSNVIFPEGDKTLGGGSARCWPAIVF